MSKKKLIRNSVAAAAVFGAVLIGGSAVAGAESDSSTSSGASSTECAGPGQGGPGGGHEHAAVTGDELAQVTAAVTAYDASITVEKAHQDPDGSFDVRATKDGERLMLEVSADLQTVTEREAPAGGPHRHGHGQAQDD